MLQQQKLRTPPRRVLPRARFLKEPGHEPLRSSQHWLSPHPTSNQTCLPGSLGRWLVLNPRHSENLCPWSCGSCCQGNYQGLGLALVGCSRPHCHYETEVRAEFPLLAPQRPPPARVPCWSLGTRMALSYIGTAVSSVPILHLHLDLLAPWERIQGTGDSEPPTPQMCVPWPGTGRRSSSS